MSAILSLIPGELIAYIFAAVAALGGGWVYGRLKKREGRVEGALDAVERDLSRAREIEEKADAVDVDGNAIERLREHGQLRD